MFAWSHHTRDRCCGCANEQNKGWFKWRVNIHDGRYRLFSTKDPTVERIQASGIHKLLTQDGEVHSVSRTMLARMQSYHYINFVLTGEYCKVEALLAIVVPC